MSYASGLVAAWRNQDPDLKGNPKYFLFILLLFVLFVVILGLMFRFLVLPDLPQW